MKNYNIKSVPAIPLLPYGPGIESWLGQDFLPLSRPSFQYNWYQVPFQGVKRPRLGVNHPPSSSAKVKERELYLYSPSGHILGWTETVCLQLHSKVIYFYAPNNLWFPILMQLILLLLNYPYQNCLYDSWFHLIAKSQKFV